MAEPTITPPAASPPPATPAPTGQPVVPPSSTTMPAGTDYKAKFDGLRGAMMALQTQTAERIGSLEQQLRAVGGESTMKDEKLSAAEVNITNLTEQVSGLPALQERADKVETLEAQGLRLEAILRYPEIVGKTELVAVEGEDEKFNRVNPFLDALLSSTLSGDDFVALAEQMAGQLGTGGWTEGEVIPSGPQQVGPNPPTPVPSGSADDLRAQALEAQRAGDYDKANGLWDQVSAKRAQS